MVMGRVCISQPTLIHREGELRVEDWVEGLFDGVRLFLLSTAGHDHKRIRGVEIGNLR